MRLSLDGPSLASPGPNTSASERGSVEGRRDSSYEDSDLMTYVASEDGESCIEREGEAAISLNEEIAGCDELLKRVIGLFGRLYTAVEAQCAELKLQM